MRRAALLAVLVACGEGEDPDPGPEPLPARGVLRVPGVGQAAAFYDTPYPNDLRLTADGRVDLSSHPRPNELVGAYFDAAGAAQRGFGLASAIYLRFDGPLDPRTLPGPFDAAADDSPVYLVDVDPGSPRRGARVPIDLAFRTEALEVIGEDYLVAQPFPGFVLDERTTYALVVTSRVRAGDGSPVSPAGELEAILGDAPAAELASARAVYQPLVDHLDEAGGDERSDVAHATVFTTQDATSLLGRIRDVIYRDVPAPTATDVELVDERDGFAWYDARYPGPIFQTGEVPYDRPADGGAIAIDPATGDPLLHEMQSLRVSFTLPLGSAPAAGWPVAIYAHGTGGDYHSFVADGTAARLAAAGLACVSIDQVMHGPRNDSAPPEVAFFNFINPDAARDNTLQGALDDFQLVRLVVGLDLTVGGRTIRFDPDRVTFFGHSQGSLTGVPFVAHEPRIGAAVFSGAGALLYQALLHKTEPLDVTALVALLIRDVPLDRFHPTLNIVQAFMERADSASYARRLTERDGAPSILLTSGLVDHFTPVETLEPLAVAAAVDHVGPVLQEVPGLAEAGGEVTDAPLTGNRGAATAALVQYAQAAGSDGHFVVFDVDAAQRQSIEFLRTFVEDGVSSVVGP